MAQPLPEPKEWLRRQLLVTRAADREIIAALEEAEIHLNRRINSFRRDLKVGEEVRRRQLMLARAHLSQEQARLWRKIGDIVAEKRVRAVEGVIDLSTEYDAFLMRGLEGGREMASLIGQAELDLAKSGMDRMIARTGGASYTPLSQRVYNSEVGVGKSIDRMVNSALAQGLSAAEFAKMAEPFINPHTPGGLRYAALRLGRTEINNAAHAMSVTASADKPWVTGQKWHLSGSHPSKDICDILARGGPEGDGVYRRTEVPSKPHPQCFCYITPVLEDEEAFLDSLVGGKYDTFLGRYMKENSTRQSAPLRIVKSAAKSTVKSKAASKPAAEKAAKVAEKIPAKSEFVQVGMSEAEKRQTAMDFAFGGSTGSGSLQLNAALRGQAKMTPGAKELQERMDRMFAEAEPLKRPRTVYRAVSGDEDLARRLVSIARQKGTFKDPGYLSTATKEDSIEDFLMGDDDVIIHIQLKAGAKVIDMDKYLDFNQPGVFQQNEIVLNRSSELRFSSITKTPDGEWKIIATLIG